MFLDSYSSSPALPQIALMSVSRKGSFSVVGELPNESALFGKMSFRASSLCWDGFFCPETFLSVTKEQREQTVWVSRVAVGRVEAVTLLQVSLQERLMTQTHLQHLMQKLMQPKATNAHFPSPPPPLQEPFLCLSDWRLLMSDTPFSSFCLLLFLLLFLLLLVAVLFNGDLGKKSHLLKSLNQF